MLNKKELSELIEVESHTVTRWEGSHTEEPTRENIEALTIALDYPKEFFFGSDIDEPSCETASFRSQTLMSAAIRDAAFAAVSIGFYFADWIETKFDLPSTKVPDLHVYHDDPEAAAQTVRQEWGCGEKPISNMIQLLESKGVRIFSLAANTATLNAFSLWRDKKPYIFLNNFKSAESSRFDAAHELAHLVLHQDGSATGRQAELQAHRFASAFLMPRADILSQMPILRSVNQLTASKRRWKVSVAALNYRVHQLKLTSEWKYRDFCIEIAKRGYRTAEPSSIEREKSKVWEMVLKALWADMITQRDIAIELHLPEAELNDLLCGVLNPVEAGAANMNQPLSLVVDNDKELL